MAPVVLRVALVLVLASTLFAGCSRPQPELVAGCFTPVELTAGDFAKQSGGNELYVWRMGNNAGDDLLKKYGFAGHLLALPSPDAPTMLDGSVRLRLTGRVLKIFPSGVERHIGRARAHELAEALVNGKRYLVHATKAGSGGEGGWDASLPSRCRALPVAGGAER